MVAAFLAPLAVAAGSAIISKVMEESSDEATATDLIRRRATGQGPSPARVLANRQAQQIINSQRQLALQQGGMNPIAALRQASRAGAQAAGNAALAGSQAAAQEQIASQGQLAQLGARQTDFDRRLVGGAVGATAGAIGQAVAAQEADPTKPESARTVMPQEDQNFQSQAAMSTSDERLKSEIEAASGMDLDQFMRALRGRRFVLHDGPDPGQRTGVMAQDLQQSNIGREMVRPDERGVLQVDNQRMQEGLAASVGRLEERLRTLEAGGPGPVLGAETGITEARGRSQGVQGTRRAAGVRAPARQARQPLEDPRDRLGRMGPQGEGGSLGLPTSGLTDEELDALALRIQERFGTNPGLETDETIVDRNEQLSRERLRRRVLLDSILRPGDIQRSR